MKRSPLLIAALVAIATGVSVESTVVFNRVERWATPAVSSIIGRMEGSQDACPLVKGIAHALVRLAKS